MNLPFNKNYYNNSELINWKELKKDFFTLLEYDEYLHYKFFEGLGAIESILENRMFNHSARSYDIRFLAFIVRNRKELKIVLSN